MAWWRVLIDEGFVKIRPSAQEVDPAKEDARERENAEKEKVTELRPQLTRLSRDRIPEEDTTEGEEENAEKKKVAELRPQSTRLGREHIPPANLTLLESTA
ncbi:hypothetical protein CC86DRAFT_386252 [Ophiobolus disseminans]|uniref:Uncharacterized protein n=1 Tax=Ophiobolus disseminans TaxID=1469910 RepID=A0A6A6ZLG0_9PLEO|nr:hypothetical protein CC86DRAFT_386252 [Ophiobolus disseminans]